MYAIIVLRQLFYVEKKDYANTGGARNGLPPISRDAVYCVFAVKKSFLETRSNAAQATAILPINSRLVRLLISSKALVLCVWSADEYGCE